MAPGRDVLERTILDGVIRSGWISQLGVALDIPRGQLNACGLGCGGIWGVEVMVSFKGYKLLLGLCDLGGVRLQYVCVHSLDDDLGLGSGGQR